jgi:hypothetical protein
MIRNDQPTLYDISLALEFKTQKINNVQCSQYLRLISKAPEYTPLS